MEYAEPCWFFYTSGTTGRPKAAVLTHGQMAFVVTNHLADLFPGTTERDASLVVAPLSHGAGIHQLGQVARGAGPCCSGGAVRPGGGLALVEEHRVSNMFTVPTILTALVEHPAVERTTIPPCATSSTPARRCTAPTRSGRWTARPLPGAVFRPRRGHRQHHRAAAGPAQLDDAADCPRLRGAPRTGMDLAILDEAGPPATGRNGRDLRPGPAVFAGYFENPEANARAFAGGWFHTGDLGHLDARGFLYVTGRASDMYISGGSNVYPREVEEAILTHPAVAECAVVGIPHPRWGEAGSPPSWRPGAPHWRGGGARAPEGPHRALQAAAARRGLGRAAEIGLRQGAESLVRERLGEEGVGF